MTTASREAYEPLELLYGTDPTGSYPTPAFDAQDYQELDSFLSDTPPAAAPPAPPAMPTGKRARSGARAVSGGVKRAIHGAFKHKGRFYGPSISRPLAAGDAEMAIMNPAGAPPDVIFADEWGSVAALPAKPHAEFNGTYTPGSNGKNGTQLAVQQAGVPNNDRGVILTKHPFRQAMVYMQNSPVNSGVTTTNTLGQVSYAGVFERKAGVDSFLFPVLPGSPDFLRPVYAVPATAATLTTVTGLTPLCTWPAHGNYLYPGHDNKDDMNSNVYGFWIDGVGAASANPAASGSVWLSLDWTPSTGAVHNFQLYRWDGEQFVAYDNGNGKIVNLGFTPSQTANQWYNMTDGTNVYVVLQSGYYAVRYTGQSGTTDTVVTATTPGHVRVVVANGAFVDSWSHIAAPNIHLERDTMRRCKTIGSAFLMHPTGMAINRAGAGTILACKGGDWDPVRTRPYTVACRAQASTTADRPERVHGHPGGRSGHRLHQRDRLDDDAIHRGGSSDDRRQPVQHHQLDGRRTRLGSGEGCVLVRAVRRPDRRLVEESVEVGQQRRQRHLRLPHHSQGAVGDLLHDDSDGCRERRQL